MCAAIPPFQSVTSAWPPNGGARTRPVTGSISSRNTLHLDGFRLVLSEPPLLRPPQASRRHGWKLFLLYHGELCKRRDILQECRGAIFGADQNVLFGSDGNRNDSEVQDLSQTTLVESLLPARGVAASQSFKRLLVQDSLGNFVIQPTDKNHPPLQLLGHPAFFRTSPAAKPLNIPHLISVVPTYPRRRIAITRSR